MIRTSSVRGFLRRTVCGCLAAFLFLGTAANALAANYTASNADEMESSWAAASSNSDTHNYIEVTNDIDMSGRTLVADPNKWYNVQSEDGYDLSDVRIDGGDDGGTVYIRTDITSHEGAALTVGGDVVVNVIGDISTTSTELDDGNNPVVEVYDDAIVAINGDVTAAEAGITVSNSRLTVVGDVTLKSEGEDYNNFVVDAYNSTVNINGDVKTEELGILAMENSNVTVEGDVTLVAKGELDMNNAAVTANSDSTIHVTGNVTSGEGGLTANDAKIIVDKNVNVEGASSFVSDATGEIHGSFNNVPAEANSDLMSGVMVWDSTLTIDNGLKTTYLDILNNSNASIYVDLGADYVSIGGDGQNDASTLIANDIDSDVYAAGSSFTKAIGSVRGHVTACEKATMEVIGSVKSYDVFDDAVLSIRNTNYNTGAAAPETIVSPESTEDDFVVLCKTYKKGSELYDYTSSLMQANHEARNDILDELGWGDAFLVSLFDRYGVNLDTLDLPRAMMDTTFVVINPTTQKAIDNADFVSGYHVKLYKENLHEILTSAEAQATNIPISKKDVKTTAKIIKSFHSVANNADGFLSPDQLAVFTQYASSDGLDINEAMKFLLEFDFITEIDSSAKSFAQRLVDMYDLCENLKSAGKTLEAIEFLMDSAEFIDYWASNYESQIAILDDMIYNQPMNAELAVAAITLRGEYYDKFSGTMLKLVDKGKEEAVKQLKKSSPLLVIVDAAIDLTGLLTGATAYSEEVMDATALFDIVPQMQINFESAVMRIQKGDTSEEAITTAKNAHALLVGSLKRLCSAATKVCEDPDVVAKYENILQQLENNTEFETLNF